MSDEGRPATDALTYADAGVDLDRSEAATGALIETLGSVDDTAFAGLLDMDDRYLALATDGVGTKLLVADAIEQFDTIGIDCIAMNANDLVAMGVEPIGFVDYLAVDEPDESMAASIGEGIAAGAREAGVSVLGGETAVLPEIVTGFDLAGTCVGSADHDDVLDGLAEPGDALIGSPSSGIHSNGLTLARQALTRDHHYNDPFPPDPDRSIGEVLLEPTRLYTDLLPAIHRHEVHGAAHITGGGLTNLSRLGSHRYVIDEPLPVPPIFDVIQNEGSVADEEMYRTFNMGIGFVVCVPPAAASDVTAAIDGQVIGHVAAGDGIEIQDVVLDD